MNETNSLRTSHDKALEQPASEENRAFRERELLVKERECDLKEAEFELKKAEHATSHWKSPLIVAIFAAAVAAAGNAIVGYINAHSQITLEAKKAEQARILEMIKTGNPDKAAENLRFLLKAGLIIDPIVRDNLTIFLDNRIPGSGPALPPASFTKEFSHMMSKLEGTRLEPYGIGGLMYIGSGHELTQEEIETGKLIIDGKPIDFTSGISEEQAKQLLRQDLEPLRKEIEKLVTVKLTRNQSDSLTSFASNIGMSKFKTSELLKKLNSGKYDEVPNEMMRWTKVGGKTFPGLVKRREAEIELWRKP